MDEIVIEYAAGAAYLDPPVVNYPSHGGPEAHLSRKPDTPLTPILDTGASHCLLPITLLTEDEINLASR
eukprot:6457424-Amphidinium_carterae.1